MNPAGSIMLDTNVIIAHFRRDSSVTTHLQTASTIYLPWVALGELQYGALRAERREAQLALISEFLQITILLYPDQSTCARYGQLKAELAESGRLIPDNDIWIAALAQQYDLPLATRDAHFAAIARLETVRW
jgi:tRNA(fMet)-specific endonuclease VapC